MCSIQIYLLASLQMFYLCFVLSCRMLLKKKRTMWIKPGRTEKRWRQMIAGKAPEDEWKNNFRISRACFVSLVEMIRPYALI